MQRRNDGNKRNERKKSKSEESGEKETEFTSRGKEGKVQIEKSNDKK